jgi:hypothetical protein
MPSPPAAGQYKVTREAGQDFVDPQDIGEIITVPKDEVITVMEGSIQDHVNPNARIATHGSHRFEVTNANVSQMQYLAGGRRKSRRRKQRKQRKSRKARRRN